MKHKIQGWKIAKQRGAKKNRISPFAPSKNEIAFYQKYINKVAEDVKVPQKALTLGATPELRDGAIKAGLESYAVDISKEMADKFSLLMGYRHHPLDKTVICDWLKMKFPENYFGIIMGDASFINLANRKDNNDLAKVCANTIGKGGYLVLRQVVYPKHFKSYKSVGLLVNDYRNKKISWEDFFMELRIVFYKDKLYNKKTFQYDAGKSFEVIDKLFENKILTDKEYKKINIFRNNVINTFYPEDNFIKMIESKGFKLVAKFHDKPFRFFRYLYIMTFRKI